MEVLDIINQFDLNGSVKTVNPYGEGHINRTFLAVTENKRYILQKINTALFTDVDKLMHNIVSVTAYLNEKKGGVNLTVVKTKDGKNYFRDEDGSCYRVYEFIENATAYQKADENLFYQSAVAFGSFANDLSEFDASTLYEILPSFHDTNVRFSNFLKAVEEDKVGRKASVSKEIEFYTSRQKYCNMIVGKLNDGTLPLRVTHNDTKLNNVMLDNETGKPVAVIDLDTVMPGSVCYDFGDSIRFGCNTGAEDEPDLSKVTFSYDLYKSYEKGYFSAFPALTEEEKKMLPYGAIIMTYECGMRFLTDYLQGDTYFKTTREGQNLDRCHTQMKLVEEMEKILI